MKSLIACLLLFFLFTPAYGQNKKVKLTHKKCKSTRDLAPYFKKCKPVKCGDRRIFGMKDGKCKYVENIEVAYGKTKMKSKLSCMYPKSYLKPLADMYGGYSNKKSEQEVVNEHVNSSTAKREAKLAKMKSYTIDGKKTKNPTTLATSEGHCKQTFGM